MRQLALPVSEMSAALKRRARLKDSTWKAPRAIHALCLSLLCTILLSGLLGSDPARAAEPVAAESDSGSITPTARGQVLELWKTGGTGMKAAAEAALLGSESDVKYFLEQVKDKEEFADNRVATGQLINVGGRGVQDAALKALGGTPRSSSPF